MFKRGLYVSRLNEPLMHDQRSSPYQRATHSTSSQPNRTLVIYSVFMATTQTSRRMCVLLQEQSLFVLIGIILDSVLGTGGWRKSVGQRN